MGLRPVAIYAYSTSTNYILRQESLTGQITIDHESLLLVFRASDFSPYRVITRPKITFTTHRHPTADEWDVSFNNKVMLSAPRVGEKVSFDNSSYNHGSCYYVGASVWHPGKAGTYSYSDYPIAPTFDEYVYFTVYASAANVDGNVGTLTTDQKFTFSGFDLTYTTGTLYPFAVTSGFMGGYKNRLRDNSFELSAVYYSDVITQYSIANCAIYYRKTGASSYQSITSTGNAVTVPAETFDSDSTYDVYFTSQSTSGASASTDPVTLSTVDGPAVTTAVSPNNEVTYGTVPFRWNYSNITGELQHAFDLQISTDNSNWTDVFTHEVTDQTQVTAEITTSGTVYWRVRGYNQSDAAGEWSASVSFANVVPPQPPVILEIIPGGRTKVRWSAAGQTSYQLQVLQEDAVVYDSGIVYGTSTLARVNEYLTNGQYTARVRVSNSYGLTSEWDTMNYQQQSQLPDLTYTANYSEAIEGVRITVQDTGYEKFYLIRNGVLAAKFTGAEYIDRFAAGTTQYRLIGVNAEDNFGQAVFTVTVPAGDARLITEDGLTLSVAERWENMNVTNQSEEIRASANEFFGATAPEHTFSKMHSKRITRAFYDPDRISAQLLGRIAFYTDEYGNADWVAVISRTRSDSWIGDETTIEMELTARNEVVTYDN